MGDFNFPELDWSKPESLSESHPFLKCLNDNFLEQLVDEPTRDANILDLVVTSDMSMINNLTVGEPFETSDHQMIRFELTGKRSVVDSNTTSYNYFKANYTEVRNFMRERNWNLIPNSDDVNNCWKAVRSEIILVRDRFVPKFKKCKNKCKWVTKEVVRLRKAKVKAWNNYIKSGRDRLLFEVYKSKLRLSVRENIKAKRRFEEKLAKNIKNDNKRFFAYVRSTEN
jgi:hypothetical protein